MSTTRLTPASHVVLGLIEHCQPATVYDLKRLAAKSVVNFWSLPHTQLYSETERLAKAGLLDEERERTGRRRRVYRLTEDGRAALDEWRDEPTSELYEVHDPAMLKLFFGGNPTTLASEQVRAHERKLQEYERTRETLEAGGPQWPEGMRMALEAGIGLERQFIDFWRAVAGHAGEVDTSG